MLIHTLAGLGARCRVTEIDECARRAHGREGPRGHHIHLVGSLLRALVRDDVDHLFGSDDNHVAGPDFIVDLLNRFLNLKASHAAVCSLGFKIIYLDCVIGRRSISIRFPPY